MRDLRRSGTDARGQFRAVSRRAADQAGRPVREGAAMNRRASRSLLRPLGGLAGLAFLPATSNAYHLSLAISLLQFTVLATAWGMFSGPTRYVSLATAAFFGVGAYTVAVLGEVLPWPLVLGHCRGRSAVDGGDCRPVDAATERRPFRDLHLWTCGTGAPARGLVRGQQDARARPLCLRGYHAERHLLAASCACGCGLRDRLDYGALAARIRAAHHRRR